MHDKTRLMQSDQLAMLVAVERIAEMLCASARGQRAAQQVRVEHGIPGLDDVVEVWTGRDDSRSERRWQVKRQSTALDREAVVSLLRTLAGAPQVEIATLALRDLVDVPKVAEIRHLRDLCARLQHGEPSYVESDATAGAAAWIAFLKEALALDSMLLMALLRRFTIDVVDERRLELDATRWLELAGEHRPDAAFAAIHSFLARHPDGAVPYDVPFVRREVLGVVAVEVVRSTQVKPPGPPPWIESARRLATVSQRQWGQRIRQLLAEIDVDPDAEPLRVRGPAEPGDEGFLWDSSKAPTGLVEHANVAYAALRYFARPSLPARIGDFIPASHPLAQTTKGNHWTDEQWPSRRQELYEGYIEPIGTWVERFQHAPRLDPTLHHRLLEIENQIAHEEARSRPVDVTYVRNMWPGHAGTYRAGWPGLPELVIEVGQTVSVPAERAAIILADFGTAFSVSDENLPRAPVERGRRFLTTIAMEELRGQRHRLRVALGLDRQR